jgi:S-formylglutathione hydrolase FrmB
MRLPKLAFPGDRAQAAAICDPAPHRWRLPTVFMAVALAVATLASCSSSSSSSSPPVNTQGARISYLTIDSRFVARSAMPSMSSMPLTLVTPAGGGAHRPLLVFLHGHAPYDNNSQLTNQMFAALHALGPSAPDIVFPYGDNSYWHNRASGAWASYMFDEVIPKALTVLHADPRRVAIGGISMGGYGAYDLARLDPGRFCAVGGHSAAIWPTLTSPNMDSPAFDNAGDFARNDVLAAAKANPELYGHAQLWLDVGAQDPYFISADRQLASILHIQLHMWPGVHDFTYWNAHWGDYLGFYAHALATCG